MPCASHSPPRWRGDAGTRKPAAPPHVPRPVPQPRPTSLCKGDGARGGCSARLRTSGQGWGSAHTACLLPLPKKLQLALRARIGSPPCPSCPRPHVSCEPNRSAQEADGHLRPVPSSLPAGPGFPLAFLGGFSARPMHSLAPRVPVFRQIWSQRTVHSGLGNILSGSQTATQSGKCPELSVHHTRGTWDTPEDPKPLHGLQF